MVMYRLQLVTFANMVNDFYDFMGRDKWPPNGRIAAWYEKLKSIQESEVTEAFSWMKDSLDSLPHNIPKAVKAAVLIIRKEKPQEQALKPGAFGPCHDCNGAGAYKLRVCAPEGYWYEPIAYCASCDNYRIFTNTPGDRVTPAELQAMGVLWKPHNVVLRKSRTIVQGGATDQDFDDIAADLSGQMRI
jgi:hypothetical protein